MADVTTTPSLPLADIHLPAAPGLWPLAWGWWVCLVIAVIAVVFLGRLCWRHRQQNRARREALLQLQRLTQPNQFGELNQLLRQMAMTYRSRQQVAGLTGEHWLSFLDAQLPMKHTGFMALSDEWQQGLFSPTPLSEKQYTACLQQATVWIKKAQFVQHEQNK